MSMMRRASLLQTVRITEVLSPLLYAFTKKVFWLHQHNAHRILRMLANLLLTVMIEEANSNCLDTKQVRTSIAYFKLRGKKNLKQLTPDTTSNLFISDDTVPFNRTLATV